MLFVLEKNRFIIAWKLCTTSHTMVEDTINYDAHNITLFTIYLHR